MPNFDDLFREQAESEAAELPAFDEAEFRERKQKEREDTFALIDSTAEAMKTDGELFQTFLDVQSRFDRYSVSNALLVTAQNPEATKLNDFDTWKKANVSIKSGETAITILKAGKEFERTDGTVGVYYNPTKVFDISQTNSRLRTSPTVTRDERLLLKSLITHAPCKMEISEQMADQINAVYRPQEKTIYVRQGLDAPTIFKALSQELAHAHMDSGEGYRRSDCANAAYCVSYLLCKRYGVATDTFNFSSMPEQYKTMETKDFRQELSRIRETFKEISVDMGRFLEDQERSKRERSDDAR